MALSNPLGMIKNVAVGTIKVPVTVAGSVLGLVKAVAKHGSASQPEPVNVTEELVLDPAPVSKPKPANKTPRRKPTTAIDAAADPSKVDATPADVAEIVSKDAPA